ncbi:MAG TPA: cardiolipin synthase [Polyangiaceae bacterium]|nr:cardiolipin synthase [Polyangiaceae bacterium]
MPWFELHRALPLVLRVADDVCWVVALGLVPLVLVRRKEPSSTIAWILTLVLLPPIGAVLFLLFGRDRVRWPARRKRALDAMVSAQVDASRDGADADATAALESPLERALFRVGARLTHMRPTSGNRVTVLVDGNATYDEIGAAIDGARHHVHAQYYLIRNDATGAWFRDRLIAAAKRGVVVRLLLDGYGCFALGASWRRPLRKAGVRVAEFLPMHSVLLQPVNLRNHRKIVVVDGEVAFTGGFNVGDEYRGQMRGLGGWRDVHLRVEGPAAAELQRVFFQDWAFATSEPIAPDEYFPRELAARGDATVAVVTSGPDTRSEAIHRLFFGAIVGAEREVLVTTPYFVPTESLLVAMEVAAMRGVRMKLLLPGRSNHRVTFHAGRSFYAPLLEAGVELLEYQPGIVHAKTLVADGVVALVGSANMDMRSFRLNFEVHTVVHDATTAASLSDVFRAEAAASRAVDLTSWRARGASLRVKEGAARLVSPLL